MMFDITTLFEKFTDFLIKKLKFFIIAALILTLITIVSISFIQIDNDISKMIPLNHPDRIFYEECNRIFGNSDYIIIGISAKNILNKEFLEYLKTVVDKINRINIEEPLSSIKNLLKVSDEDATLLIRIISEQSFLSYDEISSLLKNPERLQNESFLSPEEAKRISSAVKLVSISKIVKACEVPIKDIQSLVDASYVTAEKDKIITGKLIDFNNNITLKDIEELRSKISEWNIYEGSIISKDKTVAGILIRLSSMEQKKRRSVNNRIKNILKEVPQPFQKDFKIVLSGEPVIVDEISKSMTHDMSLLIPLVVFVIVIILWLSFRSVEGVIFPLSGVVFASLWTLGIMSIVRIPINMISTAMPVLIVAVGSAYSIHFLTAWYRRKESNIYDRLKLNMKEIGVAILTSALTTVAGFASLATSEFVAIRDFGIFTALGVLFCLFFSVCILPFFVLKFSPGNRPVYLEKKSDLIDSVVLKLPEFVLKSFKPVVIVSCIISVLLLCGFFFLNVDMNYVKFFKKNSTIRMADDFLNSRLSGTQTMSVIFFSKDKENILKPDILKKIDEFALSIQKEEPAVKKVLSINDLIKRINRVLHNNMPQKEIIPSDEQSINDYLLMYSGDLMSSVTEEHDGLRVVIFLKRTSTKQLQKIKKFILNFFDDDFLKKYNLKIKITGVAQLQIVINQLIVSGQLKNILTSLLSVFLINLLIFQNLVITLISLIPVISSIIAGFGLMGFLNIPLNAGTTMVASVSIGVGIDYAIHILIGYRQALKEKLSVSYAVRETILNRGRGIIINILSVAAGFSVLLLSGFIPLVQFGIFVSLNMFVTGIAALILIPSILLLTQKKFLKNENVKGGVV